MTRWYGSFLPILVAAFVVGASVPPVMALQANGTEIKHEYFVQQAADEDLLITINSFEAEFDSSISGQDGEVLLESGSLGSRIVPVFQYITAPERSRQLDIVVTSDWHTARSKFGLELTRLKVWDDRSDSISRAYKLLSFGMQKTNASGAANWTVKIDSLINAGRLFEQFGMQEMRLWSNYLAAHLIQLHLRDYSIVYSMTNEILADLKKARIQRIELATLQLQSAALIGLRNAGALNFAAGKQDPVQLALARTAELAEAMGFYYERAYALKASGADYAARSDYQKALAQFQLAVQLADAVGDTEMATGIRESIVQIHSSQGDTGASGDVLQKIETQLLEDGAGDELALNLLAQGRLFNRSYHYDQAIDVLYQALNYENDSAIRKQVNFELGFAFYESGRFDESSAYLQLAEVSPDTSQVSRVNPIIDIGKGLQILANIHRSKDEYPLMRRVRAAQGKYKPTQARYLYDRALDELAASGKNGQQVESLFMQSYKVAVEDGDRDIQHLARLQICAIGGSVDTMCSKARAKVSLDWLLAGGVPKFSIEARYLYAQVLVRSGQKTEAIEMLDRAVNEVHLLHYTLSGVLGAWYRERHDQLFEYYLELLARGASQSGRSDAAALLGLSKIRYIEKHAGSAGVSGDMAFDTDLLRTQLAQRENAAPGQDLLVLMNNINLGLAAIRAPFEKKFDSLSKSGLQKFIRGLSSDEIVLTYHISPTSAQVWVVQKTGVQRRNIPGPGYIFAALQEARLGLADLGGDSFNSKMDALGERLISPVAELLTKKIYWIPAGLLLGFPLDALRLNGRYLVENHSVVNLMSFPAATHPASRLQAEPPASVFLAGFPQEYTGDYATRLETSAEIRTVADIFVGPGLRIVQGTALLPDEFSGEVFQKAKLMHLCMPGVIDLKYPEQSSFELSGNETGSGRASLKPSDIQSQALQADLVFLSATATRGNPQSDFASHTGIISEFMASGAQSVVARMWNRPGESSEALINSFYRELENSGNVADALSAAKRERLINKLDNDDYDWAGYQLFID